MPSSFPAQASRFRGFLQRHDQRRQGGRRLPHRSTPSDQPVDPLSDVLSLLEARSFAASSFQLPSEFAVQFPGHEGIKCYAVTSGTCWLAVEGLPKPIELRAGDCVLLHLGDPAFRDVGWLFALADPHLNAAISLMHADPAHPWAVKELAERVGMSRSVFALRFKERVGCAPMEYLSRWRMLRAGQRLHKSSDSISEIASSLGYESEAAFRKAFRGVMGCSPRDFGRGARPGASPCHEPSQPTRREPVRSRVRPRGINDA